VLTKRNKIENPEINAYIYSHCFAAKLPKQFDGGKESPTKEQFGDNQIWICKKTKQQQKKQFRLLHPTNRKNNSKGIMGEKMDHRPKCKS